MFQYLGHFSLQFVFDQSGHADKLGELRGVDRAPVTLLHHLEKAPEDFFLIFDVKQEKTYDIVHALTITDFIVVISISFEHVK